MVGALTATAQEAVSQDAEQQPLAAESLLLDVLQTANGRFVAVGERGHVVLSDNAEEWQQAARVPTRSTLTSVTAVGDKLWAAGHDSVIIASEDGGENWTRQFFDPERQQPILDIHFFDENNGFAMGAYALMLRTRDGGQTWEEHYVSDEEWHLNGLVDLGQGQLIIAGEAGYSYISSDQGESWEVVELPYLGSMFSAVSNGDCVLAYGLRGNVQESCDAGASWSQLDSPTEASLAGGAMQNGSVMLVGNSGQLLERRSDGQFVATLHPSGMDFAAVLPLREGEWLLVGEGGTYRYPPREGAR